MKKLGMMVWILFGAVTIFEGNYALAEGPHRNMRGKARFDATDTNNDGRISRDEHMAKCEKRFNAMDANKDEFVSREELREVRREIRKQREERRSQRQHGTKPSGGDPGETQGSSD
jgi:hypothetical protein